MTCGVLWWAPDKADKLINPSQADPLPLETKQLLILHFDPFNPSNNSNLSRASLSLLADYDLCKIVEIYTAYFHVH